jgi:outer membrane receptor protein involved in Fe transport
MYYIQVSKGFRSGQGNLTNGSDPLAGTPIPRFYGPDSLWNYEIGAKTSALDGRLTLNGDIYDIQWSRIQLQELSPSGFNYTANAGQAWIRGFDFQAHSQLTHALEAGLSLDYHQSRMTEVAPNAVAVRGDELPGSSRLSSYVYGKYNFPITAAAQGFFRLDYSYSSRAFSNLDNASSLRYGNVGSYDAQLGAHVKKYEFLLFGRNLANAHNRVNAFEFLGVPTQVLQEPRTIGVTLRWNY